ncbi:unnamed protein product [Strongylus vulgaris]|uniref:Uncharacterized protein n=1 Tax=Strongylus vulgaris TaxID=40348 RepID=A0A3P7L666_STRVU|nr:unnamed protein product [Strongylus vulgaris]
MFGEIPLLFALTACNRKRSLAHWVTSTASDVIKTSAKLHRSHGFWTKKTRQRLAIEIVSCSAPTTPGQSPPTPIFTRFSKLQGASISNRLTGSKVKEDRC